jgi:hypothetical protein
MLRSFSVVLCVVTIAVCEQCAGDDRRDQECRHGDDENRRRHADLRRATSKNLGLALLMRSLCFKVIMSGPKSRTLLRIALRYPLCHIGGLFLFQITPSSKSR